MSQQDYEKTFYGIPQIPTSINKQKTQIENLTPPEQSKTVLKQPSARSEVDKILNVAPKIAAYINKLKDADKLGIPIKGVTLNRSDTPAATGVIANVHDKYLLSVNLPKDERKGNLRVYRIAGENNFQPIVNVTRDFSKREWQVHDTAYKMSNKEFDILSNKMPSFTESLSRANQEKQIGMER